MELPKFKIGLRVWKTVFAVAITAAIMKYAFHESPFFACIGAIVAVGRSGKESIRNSMVRNAGTFVGGIIGILMLLVSNNVFWLALGIIPIILLHVEVDLGDSIVPGCIVYFAVVYLMAETGGAHFYALQRIFFTFLGTVIGFLINMLVDPPPMEDFHKKAQ